MLRRAVEERLSSPHRMSSPIPKPTAGTARVLMPTLRRLNAQAAWCSNYEFEDVIRQVDEVDVVELEPAGGFHLRQRVARGLAWRNWHPALSRFNPGIRPVVVRRDYELFVFVCMN